MKKIKSIAQVGFKVGMVYRFDFFMHLVSSPITVLVFYFLWKAVFAHTGQEIIRGFTFGEMVSYYVLSMVITHFVWSDVETWIEWSVIDGEMVSYFTKPLKLISQMFFFEQGMHVLTFLIESLPVFIIGVVFFGVVIAAPLNLLLFFISMVMAVVLFFMLSFLLGLSAFWLQRISGIIKAKYSLFGFLSGALIPLAFFPPWFQKLSYFLPFQYFRFVPINIYLGKYSILESLLHMLLQLVWIGVLLGIALIVEKQAFKRFSGVGT